MDFGNQEANLYQNLVIFGESFTQGVWWGLSDLILYRRPIQNDSIAIFQCHSSATLIRYCENLCLPHFGRFLRKGIEIEQVYHVIHLSLD